MPLREVVITSLGELIDQVTPTEPDSVTGRRRDYGIYRGGGEVDRPILTSLDRLGGIDPPHTKNVLEEHILRNFVRYSRAFLDAPPVNDWELLVLAQHHGLPTRLLDWTYSPLVAAHFATRRQDVDADRTIWRLDWMAMHRKFDLPELALLIEDLAELFGGSAEFTPWRLLGNGSPEKEFACMIEPPSLDGRIVAQSSVFTLCSEQGIAFDDFLERHGLEAALTRFTVPAGEAGRIRDQLDLVGVDERRLFPDLDGLADRLKRYYS